MVQNRELKRVNILWTAYNEEFTIGPSITSIIKAIVHAQDNLKKKYGLEIAFKGLICHNGCTDNTPRVIEKIAKLRKGTFFEIDIIESEKGMVVAQNFSIEYLKKNGQEKNPLVIIDADSIAKIDFLFILIEQLIKHPKIKIVGGQPVPLKYRGKSIYRKFLDSVLNCRAYFPKSEISFYDVKIYHPYSRIDPQPIGPDFEEKSKIFFHGRCFIIRDLSVWQVPRESIGEDTQLEGDIHTKYGPGSIRVMYNANVSFIPLISLTQYYKTYTRIYLDLANLDRDFPEYGRVRKLAKRKLDFDYINRLPLKYRFSFYIYYLIKKTVYYMFKNNIFLMKKNKLWLYDSKVCPK